MTFNHPPNTVAMERSSLQKDSFDILPTPNIAPFSPEFDIFVEDSRSKIEVLKQQSSALKQQLNAETDKTRHAQLQQQYDSVRKELKQVTSAIKDEIQFKECISRELDSAVLDD